MEPMTVVAGLTLGLLGAGLWLFGRNEGAAPDPVEDIRRITESARREVDRLSDDYIRDVRRQNRR